MQEEGELSGAWELSSCSSSVSLSHNYCHVFKVLVAGTENLFGEVPNLYSGLSVFEYAGDPRETAISGFQMQNSSSWLNMDPLPS